MTPLRAKSALWATRCFALTVALLVTPPAAAQLEIETPHNYGEIETPRATAVSGALRATSSSLSAIYANPANMALAQVYHVGALAQLFPEAGKQIVGAAVVDSLISSTGLAGGLSLAWSQQDPGGLSRQWTDLRFGLALPVPDVLYLGVLGRYLVLDQAGTGPLGASRASGGLAGETMYETISLDVGVTLRPIPELLLSLVGQNLTSPDTSLVPLMASLGAGYLTADVSIGGEVILETTTFNTPKVRVQGGGEFLVADRLALRAGYRFDEGLGSHAVSLGLGYVDPRFSIDLGGRRSIAGAEYTTVTLGFTVHLETLSLGPSSMD